MGVDYSTVLCYGIEFSYDEIKHILNMNETQELIKDIGCNNMTNIWCELEDNFIVSSPYYDVDESEYSYMIGIKIDKDLTLQELIDISNKYDIVSYLKEICNKYKLQYQNPKLLSRVDVW